MVVFTLNSNVKATGGVLIVLGVGNSLVSPPPKSSPLKGEDLNSFPL